jgi:hypothetical protein
MSAGIFVVLFLGWACYLLPKVLKHHDQVARTRSIDRFSHTMRVLSRREVVAPPRPADNPRIVVPTDRPSRARLQARRRAAAAAARRRRRILIVLLLANVAVGSLVYVGTLQRWSVAVPAGLTMLYLVLCRTLVKRERARETTPRRRAVEEPPVKVRNPQGFEEVTADEDTAAIDLPPLSPTAAASLWDPLPVTLPTYVGKAKATRTVRTIDLTDPGVSSSGRDEADSQLVAEASAAAEPAEPAEPDEEQRAVNS